MSTTHALILVAFEQAVIELACAFVQLGAADGAIVGAADGDAVGAGHVPTSEVML